MSRKFLIGLVAMLGVCVFGTLTVGQASGANLKIKEAKEGFLAIYGNPPTTGPVGGGLGRNFGFGQDMLFRAATGKIGENLKIELENKVTSEAKDSFIGGTLSSNKTGENNPLSFVIHFADFQNNEAGGAKNPAFADTQDQPWIAEICAPKAEKCRVDPLLEVGKEANVKIEHVAFNIGPGTVVQGIVWGEWKNGAALKPPCIKLKLPPVGAAADQTLIVTQAGVGFKVGEKIKEIKGEACLISANNAWFEKEEPAIEILNE